jgi:hypothetical protein
MASQRTSEPTKVTVDADGVRTTESSRVRLIARLFVAAVALVIGATAVGLVVLRRQPQPAVAGADDMEVRGRTVAGHDVMAPHEPEPSSASTPQRRRIRAVHRSRIAATLARGAAGEEVVASGSVAGRGEQEGGVQNDDEQPELDARDVIEALREAGVNEGIAAFPPPGTDPPKPGIVVPDDYVLPEGYVRYHQVTDDGRALPPVLMFSPDYEFLDDAGKPITLPPNGIVPPEMAPPDLPIRILEVPKRKRAS